MSAAGPVVADHVCLSVEDLPAQRDWYIAAFGLVEVDPFEAPHLGIRGTNLHTPSGFCIELLEQAGSAPGPRPATMEDSLTTQGYAHLCLRVVDLDAAHRALLALGASERMAPVPSPRPGISMSYLADPEGNLIELFERHDL